MSATPAGSTGTAALAKGADGVRAYSLYVMTVLLIVYTCNFVDRVVLGILVTPIKSELHLTDTELGLLGGTAFALFYTSLGVPIGWLADRVSRVWIMTAALSLWSAFTALCGLTHSFGALFLARIGVGVGEAGGVAPAYALISDYFPPRLRARALGFYSLGIPLGSALGVYFGGYVATRFNWRTAFLALGLIGLALAPLLIGTVREPARGATEVQPATGAHPSWHEVVHTLLRKPSFWLLSLGAACGTIMGYGLLFWLPAYFQRSFGLTLLQVSRLMGSLLLIGGVSGILLGGWLADRYGPSRPAAYALIPALAFACTLPCYLLGVSLPLGPLAFVCFLIPAALQLTWLGPLVAAVQRLVPVAMRAVASAVFLFIVNLLGLGLGSWLIGMASDRLAAHYGSASLRYAIVGGNGLYVVAALLLIPAARRLARDFEPG
jgi:predicted MFS family arabinose efflux permease